MSYDEQYSQTKDVFGREPERILAAFESRLDRNHPVLDIGTGQGRNSLFLARRGFRVDAIDPSAVAVDALRAVAKTEQLPLRAFACGFDSFTPEVDSYGGVLLFGLVQILSRAAIDSLVGSIGRWLAPGGLLFVTAFTTADDSYARYPGDWDTVGRHSFANGRGDVRTFLEPGELPTLFPGFETEHHWEGMGSEHHHGDGAMERHAMAEAVLRRPNHASTPT